MHNQRRNNSKHDTKHCILRFSFFHRLLKCFLFRNTPNQSHGFPRDKPINDQFSHHMETSGVISSPNQLISLSIMGKLMVGGWNKKQISRKTDAICSWTTYYNLAQGFWAMKKWTKWNSVIRNRKRHFDVLKFFEVITKNKITRAEMEKKNDIKKFRHSQKSYKSHWNCYNQKIKLVSQRNFYF